MAQFLRTEPFVETVKVCAKLLVFGGGLGMSDERGKEASVTSLQGSSFLVNPSPYSPLCFFFLVLAPGLKHPQV